VVKKTFWLQEIRSVELEVCPMQLFFIFDHVTFIQSKICCYVQIRTKFHENRMILSRRYGDISISSAILELFYHHTRPLKKSLLLAAAACQISCQSDTQIWRYSYLNFSHISHVYSGPQMGVFGGLWTPKCDYSSSRPQGTFLRKSASIKLSTVKIRWGVWPVGELTESVTDTHTHTHTHTGEFILCPCIALDRQKLNVR